MQSVASSEVEAKEVKDDYEGPSGHQSMADRLEELAH